MAEPLTQPGIRATVQRHVSDEETVCFEGLYVDGNAARCEVEAQLALCRSHMIRINEDVRLVDQKKADELSAVIQAKGEEIRALDREIVEKTAELQRVVKRGLRAAG